MLWGNASKGDFKNTVSIFSHFKRLRADGKYPHPLGDKRKFHKAAEYEEKLEVRRGRWEDEL
jgi:hypothetical protein